MKLWLRLVLAFALLSLGALWIFAKNQGSFDANFLPSSPLPSSESASPATAAADMAPDSAAPISSARPAALTDEDIVNRQVPVPGKLSDVLADLVPRAERGDAEAAYQLFVKINDCKWAIEGSSSARPTADQAALAAEKAWLTETLAKLEDCEGLTEDQINSRAKWLTMAAEGGDPLAQLTYYISSDLIVGDASQMMANPRAVEEYKAKSLRYLNDLAGRGNVSAIMQLRTAYSAGILVPQDHVRAYAYAYLATLITGTGQNITQTLGATLTPEQLQQGQQMAVSLHRRCCG